MKKSQADNQKLHAQLAKAQVAEKKKASELDSAKRRIRELESMLNKRNYAAGASQTNTNQSNLQTYQSRPQSTTQQ